MDITTMSDKELERAHKATNDNIIDIRKRIAYRRSHTPEPSTGHMRNVLAFIFILMGLIALVGTIAYMLITGNL